jgi:hypothetical protein
MDEPFRSYVDPAFRYVHSQGPPRVRSRADAARSGVNCVALAHLVIRDLFGFELPPALQSFELFNDLTDFEPVPATYGLLPGDLVWFGTDHPSVALRDFTPRYLAGELVNFDDFPVNHVAICTGSQDDTGDYLLLHASHRDGTNSVWPMRRFRDYDRYRRVYAITRLCPELSARGSQLSHVPWLSARATGRPPRARTHI